MAKYTISDIDFKNGSEITMRDTLIVSISGNKIVYYLNNNHDKPYYYTHIHGLPIEYQLSNFGLETGKKYDVTLGVFPTKNNVGDAYIWLDAKRVISMKKKVVVDGPPPGLLKY